MSPNSYRYFISPQGDWGLNLKLYVAHKASNLRYFFNSDGTSDPDNVRYYSLNTVLKCTNNFKEVDYKTGLLSIESDKRLLVLKELKIGSEVVITPEKKLELINFLKSKKAFNQDSACKVIDEKELDYYYQLIEEKEVNSFKEKFYIDK